MNKIILFLLILFFAFACNKRDNFRPVVEYIEVNDEIADTIFNVGFPITTKFRLTDNDGVEEYRFEFIRSRDTSANLHSIEIKNIGGVNEYTGNITISFSSEILDTILFDTLGFYNITVDCFDKTGNQAFQKKVVVELILE